MTQLKAKEAKLESEREKLLIEMSDMRNSLDKLKADLDDKRELSVQLQMFQRENARLEVELSKAKSASSQLVEDRNRENLQLGEKYDNAAGDSVRCREPVTASAAEHTEKLKQIRSLQIELSDVKQRFQRCQDEKVEMRREFEDLAKEYNGFARQLSTVCRNSMIPLFIILVAAILVSRPFSDVFSRSS